MEIERTTDQPNWLELPKDVTSNILQRLGTVEIITSACQVCSLWWNICKDPFMWRTIHITIVNYSPRYIRHGVNLVKICRNAVARSCGQLEDIAFEFYVTDNLLAYIADRSGHLRCMRLVRSARLSEKGFRDVIKKLTFLEELDISFNHQLSKETFELIGQCCPLLKSLKYGRLVKGTEKIDDEAFAIAKTMPRLLHLKISGNVLTSNDGVLAILDGCPLLESLDLTRCYLRCFDFDVNDSLKKRGLEQITYQFWTSLKRNLPKSSEA
ncbi:hypothetical protein TSUD_123790 [Trifolium subterraneum]|uniref:F-box domain-containing protein n=1 Tax=Trifolium subterraneum TaxID=3900 RepID=A0A2Z6NKA6_TRISU|nr:hypothetical protein TSUD_123790 [Trifolium subterraneum]